MLSLEFSFLFGPPFLCLFLVFPLFIYVFSLGFGWFFSFSFSVALELMRYPCEHGSISTEFVGRKWGVPTINQRLGRAAINSSPSFYLTKFQEEDNYDDEGRC